jgi:hypothetical protein
MRGGRNCQARSPSAPRPAEIQSDCLHGGHRKFSRPRQFKSTTDCLTSWPARRNDSAARSYLVLTVTSLRWAAFSSAMATATHGAAVQKNLPRQACMVVASGVSKSCAAARSRLRFSVRRVKQCVPRPRVSSWVVYKAVGAGFLCQLVVQSGAWFGSEGIRHQPQPPRHRMNPEPPCSWDGCEWASKEGRSSRGPSFPKLPRTGSPPVRFRG